MKKLFLGTTALVAAGALVSSAASAEEGIKLGLGGYMNNYFGVTALDNDDANDTDFGATTMFSDGEIWFLGETTLDNGITFGANVQLESFGSGDTIDEDFVYISGSFGRINLGSENSAAYLMHYAAPSVGAPINSGWLSTFIPDDGAATAPGGFRTPQISTYLDFGNDENVITYFSPRFAGFQIGATYAPSVNSSGNGKNGLANEDTEFNNGFALGVNYVQTLGPVDLAVSGGLRHANAPDNSGAAGNRAGKDNDLRQYSVGANVGFSGFTVGGSFARENSGRATEGHSFDLGGSYATGPWSVGVTWFSSEVNGTSSDEDELNSVSAGVAYQVGPGIEASGTVLWADYEGGNDNDTDGIAGVVGIKYRF